MKQLCYILMSLLLSACGTTTTKAQKFTLPTGKYLVMFQKPNEAEKEDKFLMELTNEGVLQFIYPNTEKTIPIAKLKQSSEKTAAVEFAPFFGDLSGKYTYKYLAKGCFQLTSEKAQIPFFPFIDDEVTANNDPKMKGRWMCFIGDDEEISLDFQLPYNLKIEHREGYENTKRDAFWLNQVNGEDITVTAILFSNDFAGTLEQVRIENGKLYFNYKGKTYEMRKVEPVG